MWAGDAHSTAQHPREEQTRTGEPHLIHGCVWRHFTPKAHTHRKRKGKQQHSKQAPPFPAPCHDCPACSLSPSPSPSLCASLSPSLTHRSRSRDAASKPRARVVQRTPHTHPPTSCLGEKQKKKKKKKTLPLAWAPPLQVQEQQQQVGAVRDTRWWRESRKEAEGWFQQKKKWERGGVFPR